MKLQELIDLLNREMKPNGIHFKRSEFNEFIVYACRPASGGSPGVFVPFVAWCRTGEVQCLSLPSSGRFKRLEFSLEGGVHFDINRALYRFKARLRKRFDSIERGILALR